MKLKISKNIYSFFQNLNYCSGTIIKWLIKKTSKFAMLNCFFSKVCTIYYNQCSVAFVEYIYMSATFEGFFFFCHLWWLMSVMMRGVCWKKQNNLLLEKDRNLAQQIFDINQSRKVWLKYGWKKRKSSYCKI